MSLVSDEASNLTQLAEEALQLSLSAGADSAEIAIAHGSGSDVEFEKNDIQVALSSEESMIGIRVIREGRCGFASTNDTSTLKGIIKDALSVAAASEPHEANGFPNTLTCTPVDGLFDPITAAIGVGQVTDMGADLLQKIRTIDKRVMIDSGGIGVSSTTRVVVNSNGVRLSERRSSIGASLFGMAVDDGSPGSFVVEGNGSTSIDGFEESLDTIAARFVKKSIGALHPEQGSSFRGSVLLSPEAVSSFVVSNLLTLMNSGPHRKEKSLLCGRLGERIASPLLSLTDDATIPDRVTSTAFDREGVAKRRLELLKDGVFQSIFYNHFEAAAAGIAGGSTGHAAGSVAASPGVGCGAIEVGAGETPMDTMLSIASPCIMVERFSGSVNPITGSFSGVVKGGFLIENGQRRPVGETLIAGDLLELVANITHVSKERHDVFGSSLVPWLLCEGISVTAG